MADYAALSWLQIAWICLIIALSGLVHGALGLGFPLLATPLIALAVGIKPAFVFVLLPTLAVTVVTIVRTPGFGETVRQFWIMPIFMLAGAWLGTSLYIVIDPQPLTLLLAVAICAFLVLDYHGKGESETVKRHRLKFAAVAAFAGGFCEGAVNIAVPPLIMYFLSLGLAPLAIVRGLHICFIVGKSTQIATLTFTGTVGLDAWVNTAPLCVIAVIVLLWGIRVRERIDAGTYRRWLKIALAAMAVLLIGQFAWRAVQV